MQRPSGNMEPCSSNYIGRANAWVWVEVEILMAFVAGTKKKEEEKSGIFIYIKIYLESLRNRDRV